MNEGNESGQQAGTGLSAPKNGQLLAKKRDELLAQGRTIQEDARRVQLESFIQVVHRDPPQDKILKHKQIKDHFYLPISFLEAKMDELFLGLWKTRTIEGSRVVGNSVVYDIEVDFFHPIAKEWITRSGTGAVPIQIDAKKGAGPLDFENLIATALHKNIPAAKAYAFKNAVQSIGKIFGRDLAREYEVEVRSLYTQSILNRSLESPQEVPQEAPTATIFNRKDNTSEQ
jgi:hypothetical protein